jgi:hypothetical protein
MPSMKHGTGFKLSTVLENFGTKETAEILAFERRMRSRIVK